MFACAMFACAMLACAMLACPRRLRRETHMAEVMRPPTTAFSRATTGRPMLPPPEGSQSCGGQMAGEGCVHFVLVLFFFVSLSQRLCCYELTTAYISLLLRVNSCVAMS